MAANDHPAVLLDLDGTLSDNYPGIAASIRHALERLGEPAPAEAVLRTCVGPPLRESFARLLASDDSTRIEQALVHYRERFRDVGWRENSVYPGIPAMLQSLRDLARLFVCTAKPQPFADRIVAHFGFAAQVEGVYGADLEGVLDDKRALVAHLLRSERLDPARCTMIGDRHHDLRAARANRLRAIGVLWGYGTRDELADADALADDPGQVAVLVASFASAAADTSAPQDPVTRQTKLKL